MKNACGRSATLSSLRIAVAAACPFPVPQGSQAYIEQSVRALQLAGHRPVLVCYGHGAGDAPADIEVLRCRRIPGDTRTAAGPGWIKPLLDLALARTLSRHKWDAVLAHNYEGLLAAWLSGARPILYLPHNAMADELPHYFRGAAWARQAGALLDRTLPRRAAGVLALHERIADYLRARGCRNVTVAAPSAPLSFFPELPSFGGAPFALYTGNLDGYQNLPLLQAAVAEMRKSMPHARVVVATHDARPLDWAEVVRVQRFDDVAALLRQDAVVATPRVSWSGYPIKLLNALAAGRPQVVCESARGPVRDGENGLVVPDNDAAAFGASLHRLMTDPELRARLGQAAWHCARERHSLEVQAAALDAALRTLLRV